MVSQVPQKRTLRWAHVGRSSRRKCSLEKAVREDGAGTQGKFRLMLLGRIYPTPRQGARFPNCSPDQHWPQASQGNVSLDCWFSAPPTLPSAVLWRKLWGQRLDLGGLDRELTMQSLKVFTILILCEGPGKKIKHSMFFNFIWTWGPFFPLSISLNGFLWNILWEILLTFCFLLQISRV